VIRIFSCNAEEAEREVFQLADLLMDAVDSGASVGFLPPLSRTDAIAYWHTVIAAVREGSRILLVAFEGDRLQGSVQIALEMRANGIHRGELMKLFVHRRARRCGLARALLAELESTASRQHRTLLTLDTRKGSEAERLLESLGYTRLGEVPEYARSADGQLHTTVFFYRELK
jgi:acetyltransferase